MSRNACCVPGCSVVAGDGIPLHHFPCPEKEPERFQDWVKIIGGDIASLDSSTIYRMRRICRQHFQKELLYPKNRLCKLAVPSLLLPSLEPQKLRQQAALDETPTEGPSKRPLTDFSGDGEDMVVKKIKTQGQSSSAGSFRDGVAAVKLAVVTVKYPEEYLKAEDLVPIQELIIEKLEEAPDPLPILTVAPRVAAGAVHVSCDNSNSARWFRDTIHNMELGALKLKVVDAKDLPIPVKMAWKSRNLALRDSARALRLLQRLNPALMTDDWKVVNTLIEQTGIRRIVLMDGVSAGIIKASGYSLPGGIERYSFKLLAEDKGEVSTAEPGTGPSEDGPPQRGEAIGETPAHNVKQEAEMETGASEADLEDDILRDLLANCVREELGGGA